MLHTLPSLISVLTLAASTSCVIASPGPDAFEYVATRIPGVTAANAQALAAPFDFKPGPVVSFTNANDDGYGPCFFLKHDTLEPLFPAPTPTTSTDSAPTLITPIAANPAGLLIGHADDRAFLYDASSGKVTWLTLTADDLPPKAVSRVLGVSDDGAVLGLTYYTERAQFLGESAETSPAIPWVFRKGAYTRLGFTDGAFSSPQHRINARPTAISPTGVVLGFSRQWYEKSGPDEDPGASDQAGFWRGATGWIYDNGKLRDLGAAQFKKDDIPDTRPTRFLPTGEIILQTPTGCGVLAKGVFTVIGPTPTPNAVTRSRKLFETRVDLASPDLTVFAGRTIEFGPPSQIAWLCEKNNITHIGLRSPGHTNKGNPNRTNLIAFWPNGRLFGTTLASTKTLTPWICEKGKTNPLSLTDALHMSEKGAKTQLIDHVPGRWVLGAAEREVAQFPQKAVYHTGWLYNIAEDSIKPITPVAIDRRTKVSTFPRIVFESGSVLYSWTDRNFTPPRQGIAAWNATQTKIPVTILVNGAAAEFTELAEAIPLRRDGSSLLARLIDTTPENPTSGWYLLTRQ